MVSIKSLTLLALSISAAAAVPQYGHAHLHRRLTGTGASVAQPNDAESHRHHHHNESECGPIEAPEGHVVNKARKEQDSPCMSTHTEYVTSTSVETVTAELRRWFRTRTRTVSVELNTPAASPDAGSDSGSGTTTAGAAAATASPSNSTISSASGAKKGLSYNSNALLNQFSSAGASWAYNWAAGPGGSVPSGVEFVPMLWGKNGVAAWSGAVTAAAPKNVLSFNEPDFPEQANIPAATAAQLHIANMAPLKAKGIRVGSPAITNSNIAGQGLDWMKLFLAACGGASNNCKIDFLAFHWYNNPGTIDNFKSHVASVISLAKANGIPKVWLTEFAVNGGLDDQATFLKQALPFLESTPEVERYAYFMVGNGQMLTNNALNAAGKAYSS